MYSVFEPVNEDRDENKGLSFTGGLSTMSFSSE